VHSRSVGQATCNIVEQCVGFLCMCLSFFCVFCVRVLFVAEYIGVGLERDPVKGVRINPEAFHAVPGVTTAAAIWLSSWLEGSLKPMI